MLFADLAYKGQFTGRIAALIDDAVELRMLGLHAERLADIALARPEVDAVGPHDLRHLPPSLELRKVSFRYGEGQPGVLRDVDLQVGAGEHLALVGASGGGKTTLLKIMLGILQPSEGEVLYGGVPIAQLGLANVRRQVGTVMQEDALFTGSLQDNIAFFDLRPDLAGVEALQDMRLTRIVIAHRPETVARAQGVVRVGNGQVTARISPAAPPDGEIARRSPPPAARGCRM